MIFIFVFLNEFGFSSLPIYTQKQTKASQILIAYFSCTGNTKKVAGYIDSMIEGDLIEIIPSIPYTSADLNYNDGESRTSKENKDPSILPEISNEINDFDKYTTILIGYPIWFGKAPNIIRTFIQKYNFDNKNIITFSTSSSSSDSSGNFLPSLAPKAKWRDSFQRFSSSVQEATVKTWLDTLDLDSSDQEELQSSESSVQEGENKNHNILIAYFSCTGNTRRVAGYIDSMIEGDLIEIIPSIPYTSADLNYNDGESRTSKENKDPSILPEISNEISDFDKYTTILIGYPIWFGKAPNIIRTFIQKYNFDNKNIITFSTSSSSSDSSGNFLPSLAPKAKWNDSFQRFSSSVQEATVKTWLDTLDLGSSDQEESSSIENSNKEDIISTQEGLQSSESSVQEGENKNHNILIAYFSCTGNTRRVAGYIDSMIEGDLVEIIPSIPYTSADLNYNDGESRTSKENKDPSILPEISNEINDFDKYTTILIGYPIWFGKAPNIIRTFIQKYNFDNKNIITFSTSSSSSDSSGNFLPGLAPKAKWRDSFQRFSSSVQSSTVKTWLDTLDLDSSDQEESSSNEIPNQGGLQSSESSVQEGGNKNHNILIAYFSCTGNTRRVAGYIDSMIEGDLIEIIPSIPYTSADLNYNDGESRTSKENKDPSILPEISNEISDFDKYTTILIGYPIWFGKAPNIIRTFIQKYNFDNKNIITFSTSSSSSDSSGNFLPGLAPKAKWNDSFQRFSSSVQSSTVKTWLDTLDLGSNKPAQPPQTELVNPTQPAAHPPTKPPVKTEIIEASSFQPSNGEVNININNDQYSDDVLYNIKLNNDINKVKVDLSGNKMISLLMPPGKQEITVESTGGNSKSVDIVPQSDTVKITLGDQTKASLPSAKGRVALASVNNNAISLNTVTPQSSTFTLISNLPFKIDEVDFIGKQGMNVETEGNERVEVSRIKIQSNSDGTINNLKVNNIVFGPSSSLNIADNVDMTESTIDLAYNNVPQTSDSKAPIAGELSSAPKEIVFNTRGSEYFEDSESFLIAESTSNKFECDKWVEVFRKGPFNSKFNNAECRDENSNGKKVKRLYAIQSNNDSKGGLKPGAIAGIVIGVVVFVGIVVFIFVYFFVIKKKKNDNSDQEGMANATDL